MDLIHYLITLCLETHGGRKMIDELFAQRVFDRIDKFDDKIDNLCDRMMKVELEVTNHLNTVTENSAKKEKKFYILIASMGTLFAAVTLFQSL
jgi:uncharacterized protein YaaR (DUF327 family)